MKTLLTSPTGLRVAWPLQGNAAQLLSPDALAFLQDLHRRFEPERQARLQARREQQTLYDDGHFPSWLVTTRHMRDSEWTCAPAPANLQDRRVEITGPAERKMMINALNSGANCFMADFEDALSPTWSNVLNGQQNLIDWAHGRLSFVAHDGRKYEVQDKPATLIVRPRGWQLVESHVKVDGAPMSASLFDAGLFLYNNAKRLQEDGRGAYLYLPKMEHHLEARLWNNVLAHIEQTLGLPQDAIRVTCLIETLPAAFQMEEILFELKGRVCGLNAGRWDYLFSTIKVVRNHADRILPDRSQLTMAVPFMEAYARILVDTCHKRGVHAMGGMSAFIPDRHDPVATAQALAKVDEDKEREASQGFDGTWVAHPDLVPVAKRAFDAVLGRKPNQLDRRPEGVPEPTALLDLEVRGARPTMEGVQRNVRSLLLYAESWLRGIGAAGIDHLMEDVATAEISRAQLWQWRTHRVRLAEGMRVDDVLLRHAVAQEKARVATVGLPPDQRLAEAERLSLDLILAPDLAPFLTTIAYERLERTA